MGKVAYLDHNAATPVLPEVLDATLSHFRTSSYGSKQSLVYGLGREAKGACGAVASVCSH